MKTRYGFAFVATILVGLTLLLASTLASHASEWSGLSSSPMLAAPDLTVESITFSPANPAVGESVDVTVTVKNVGDAGIAGFYVYFYVDPADEPPTSTTAYTSRTYWGLMLDPGDSFDWARPDHTFATSGTHTVCAWVDRDDTVAESDETNNLTGPVNIPVGVVCDPDAYEEDDLCSQAHSILTDGTAQPHNLCAAPDRDEDWVEFDAIGGVTYRVQASADGADAKLALELHAMCSSPPSFGGEVEFDFTPPANGVYYLKVEHLLADHGPDTDYRLSVTALNQCNAYHEPNDDCILASDIAVDGTTQTHSFCEQGDADWVSFPAQAGSTYVVSATNLGPDADVQLALHTSCIGPPPFGGDARIEYTAQADGMIYIKAENLDLNVFGSDTDYQLRVTRIGGCDLDEHEEDNIPTAAKLLTVGGAAQTHNVCPAGDVDWAIFLAAAGVTYTVETFNLGAAADTRLCLYDATGSVQLACDDDGGAGRGSRIVWQAPTSDLYTVEATDYNSAVAGPDTRYDLRVFAGLCNPDALEPDDDRSSARPIPTDGSEQAHDVCPAGDVDWATFTASAGPYVIETTNLGPEADTVIELYDASGTRLTSNDDYDPGTASRIHHVFDAGGTYYVKVRHYDPSQHGAGTEYSLVVYQGNPPEPPPTPTPPPTLTPPPASPSSGVRTIVLINWEQVAAWYGETAATQLLNKLDELAVHDDVQGEVIRLDRNDTISATYASWIADPTDVDLANQVAAVIRSVIVTYLQQHDGVEHVLLVGDDRLLPFRRVADHTPRDDYLEQDYARIDGDHATGASLQANYFLSDDYYADREPTPFEGRELYIPDLAVGRLVETPDEIVAFIDAFLADPQITPGKTLVTGYDFVRDTASDTCADWRTSLGAGNVDCSLIGESWSCDDLRALQLNADPPFVVQSINGHANHYQEGCPIGQRIDADEIAAAPSSFEGGLIYTPGCHAGLNVPPDNDEGPLDLPQAFAQKRTNYVANTGYGWGLHGATGLSEKLMSLYTSELRYGGHASIGQAFTAAKQRYYQEDQDLTGYDEKILQEAVFYGLPMYRLDTGGAFDAPDPFPSVGITPTLPGAFGDDKVVSGTVNVQLGGTLGPSEVMSQTVTDDGVYYSLDGHVHAVPGQPVQPLLHANVTAAGLPARSALFWAGAYETLSDFDPLILSPVNDYVNQTAEATFNESGWFPPAPMGLQTRGAETSLVIQMGQVDPSGQQARLFSGMEMDLYYSLSADQTPPTITVVGGLYNHVTERVNVKVGATDPAGVQRAVATYTSERGFLDSNGYSGWDSVDLSFDADSHKWTGSFPGDNGSRYFVQVVDGAGNVAQATNKGMYFAPVVDPSAAYLVYLPLVVRNQ